MPYRDDYSRLCGPMNYKDNEGNWERKLAILDEDKCLLRFFNVYSYSPKEEKLWDMPDREIATGLITKIEKKAEEPHSFEVQMVDLKKHMLQAESEEEMEEWIKNLHRVAVDPTRRQEGQLRSSIKNSLPRENKEIQANGSEQNKEDQSTEHISYETKIIGGVVVRRPVSKKADSDSESLSGGSLTSRSMSGGVGKGFRILKQGYLTKKGAVVRNWKKRYFKLDVTSLSYYERDTDKEPIKQIATSDILHIRHSPR
ncbi:Pleckstrin-likey domain-containing family A member 2 [Exaiptasia diaphana]|nr:Pleckstrin-likey domain-containing family A member 2 [Exaiptasia diaphana]